MLDPQPTPTLMVPATTANLGPGFDCLGAALTLYNQFRFSPLPEADAPLQISVSGEGREGVATGDRNLVYQTFVRYYERLGKIPPPVRIEISLGYPLARGLGSSATAIVAGVLGADRLAGNLLPLEELLTLAVEIEGHPDNVVPAFLGGCRLAARQEDVWDICDVPWHDDIVPVVAIPDFELSTQEARRVLPEQYDRTDAIFNTAHLGLLLRGLETGNGAWLQGGMRDRIHQPYRQVLIPGFAEVRMAAIAAGAFETVISGAGPTMLALCSSAVASAVAAAMATTWGDRGVAAVARVLQIDTQGARFYT